MSFCIYVVYSGTRHDHFDRTYYDTKHLPLVMDAWQSLGLESARVFYPAATPRDDETVTLVLCECRFRDRAAADAAFASPRAKEVNDDVVNFTNIKARLTCLQAL